MIRRAINLHANMLVLPKMLFNECYGKYAIATGHYTSVMIDASTDSFEGNVSRTLKVVKEAEAKGGFVEAGLGILSGAEDDQTSNKESRYTSPMEVEEFVKRTGCDALAVAVGTIHGAYKFPEYGVCKVNIATDLRLIWTRVHREFFTDSPDLFDPVIPGQTYLRELEKFMNGKFELLGALGKGTAFSVK